ncbi:MAG: transglutaminase domain-containing protein, partial [Candidatus Altarchaeum sp.]|nr:transglutaminase domain-containing protein [Candidatus Altarchaeum sp.]
STQITQTTINTANVTAWSPQKQMVSATVNVTVNVTSAQPNITITKTASNYSLPTGGGNVIYYYNVTNTGNVPLYNVNVSDNKCNNVICPNTTLAVDQSMKCNCSTQITQTTINTANVTAWSPQKQMVSATANATVNVTLCNVDISITNLTFILATKTQKPIAGYNFDLNISINSTLNTFVELTLKTDKNITENITTDLSEGLNYKIFTLVAKGGLHNVSVHIYSQTCDNNLSNNEYNTTYNASTPTILVKRYLNNLTNQTANISFNGIQKGIMDSPKDNLTLTGRNYSKSLKGLGAKDIGTGKVVMTYKGTINVTSYGNGEISIYTPSVASSDRQSRNVTVRLKDNTNITTGNCIALSQCVFIYDGYNTEKIKLNFNNLASGTHTLEYEVNITTDINNFNYTIQSLSKGNNNQYLQNDTLTQWTQAIKNMAQNLTQNCTSDFEKVGKISKWVYENINYDINLAGVEKNASWVFDGANRRGVCAHYANLLISMCRSIGIPARGVYGDAYNSSEYLGGHAWAEVFMNGKWYTVDPTFNEIGFIDSGHVSEGYDLSTLESSYFSAEGYSISFDNYVIFYPDLKVISTTNTASITPIINTTPKWRVTKVTGSTVTYEITGIFNNSRGGPGYIVGPAFLWASSVADPIQVFVGQDKANASWNFSYNFGNLAGDPFLTNLIISTDPTPLTFTSFNVLTAATFEIYDVQVPTTIQSGTTATLNVTIRNIGAKTGTAKVEFYVDDSLNTINNNLNVPEISGINTTQFNLNSASLSQGNHTLKFVVKKSNDQQDFFIKTITVGQLTCNISNNVPCLDNQFCNSSQQCQNLTCSGNTSYTFNHTCVNCIDNSTCGAGFCNLSHACQSISCTSSNNEICRSEQFCNNTICQNLNCLPNQTAFNHTCINCVPFDLDGNNVKDIFDIVAGLEHLSKGKSISNEGCNARNQLEIDLFDLLSLIDKIGTNQI